MAARPRAGAGVGRSGPGPRARLGGLWAEWMSSAGEHNAEGE